MPIELTLWTEGEYDSSAIAIGWRAALTAARELRASFVANSDRPWRLHVERAPSESARETPT